MASNKPRFGGGTEIENTFPHKSIFAMDGKNTYTLDLSEKACTSSNSFMASEGDRLVSFEMAKDHQGSPKLEAERNRWTDKAEDVKHRRQNPIGRNLQAVDASVEPEKKALSPEAFKETPTKSTASLKGCDNNRTTSIREKFELDPAAKPDDASHGKASSVPQLQTLISIFDELGISAPMKPYTRLNDKQLSKTEYVSSDVVYCKNLFLKDRKGQFYLVIAPDDGVTDLKQLKQELGAYRNLSFADSGAMAEILGVQPGAVTPLALINESARRVKLFIHESLVETPGFNTYLAFHPLVGHLQVELSFPELRAFVEKCGVELKVCRLAGPEKSKSGSHIRKLEGFCEKNGSSEEGKEKTERNPTHIYSNNLEITHKTGTKTQLKMNDKKPEMILSHQSLGYSDTYFGECYEESKGLLWEEGCLEKEESTGQKEEAATLRNVAATEKRNVHTGENNHQACANTATPDQKNKVVKKHAPVLLATRERKGKGKLRSYLKSSKSLLSSGSGSENLQNDPQNNIIIEPDASCAETSLSTTDGTSGFEIKVEIPSKRLAGIKQSKLSPQVETFYNKLSAHKVCYQEIELSSSDSLAIGPAVGARSFLLKDKANNFFFVISHEFYELDYGRLKLALRPRKKLQRATEEEIMTVLGVDASRVTPFALMNRIDENVAVFITEKILPGNIVLCVQHPYAAGHRIVLSSSELQGLLASLDVNVASVKEKKWAEKYSFTFSQFNGLDNKAVEGRSNRKMPTSRPGETLNTKSGKASPLDGEKRRKSSCGDGSFDENKRVNTALVSYFSQEGLLTLSSAFLNLFLSDQRDLNEGTSVDAEKCTHSDIAQKSVDYKTSRTTNRTIRAEPTRGEAGISQCASITSKDREEMQSKVPAVTVDRGCSQSLLTQHGESSRSDDKQKHLTTKDILDHLENYCVRFKVSLPTANSELTQSEYEHSSSSDYENWDDARPADDRCKTTGDVEGDEEDEMREAEEDDSTELCSTIHLRDEENSVYLIVGGESDVVSRRRFRRHFHIKTKLDVLEEYVGDGQGLCVSPFSAFLSDKSTKFQRRATTLVLTTCIYVDEETKLKFMLDQSGTSIIMTSRELERYARAMGVEVSYMP